RTPAAPRAPRLGSARCLVDAVLGHVSDDRVRIVTAPGIREAGHELHCHAFPSAFHRKRHRLVSPNGPTIRGHGRAKFPPDKELTTAGLLRLMGGFAHPNAVSQQLAPRRKGADSWDSSFVRPTRTSTPT